MSSLGKCVLERMLGEFLLLSIWLFEERGQMKCNSRRDHILAAFQVRKASDKVGDSELHGLPK